MNPNFAQETPTPKRRSQQENREFRRKSLLEAAIKTVAQYDINGATVERICNAAGASRGLIAHYFESKETLLLAALRHWFDGAIEIKKQIANNPDLTAEDKLRRIAYSSFDRPSYSWEMAAAWQAFTNASRYNKAYAEPIQNASRLANELTKPLFAQAAKDNAVQIKPAEAAIGLYILDDGLWNSLATGKDALTLKQARHYCDNYIDGCLGIN